MTEQDLQHADRERLIDALCYAVRVIDSYQDDIAWNKDKLPQGFCQGEIYKTAIDTIQQKAGISEEKD